MINNSITTPKYNELTPDLKALKTVNIINPLGQELSQMRSSILPSAIEVVKFNINRQSKNLKLFELGKTYQKFNGSYKESKYLSLCLTGDIYNENWNVDNQPGAFFYFKGVLNKVLKKNTSVEWEEKNTRLDIFSEGLSYFINEQPLLEFGFLKKQILKTFDIDQEVLYAEIDFEALSGVTKKNHIEYKEIPRFPNSRRDFALLLDTSVKFDSIKEIAFKTEKSILSTVELFDVYQGKNLPEGKKSYGVSFYFQDPRKTLTDKYVDKIMEKLQKQFESKLGAQLR
jgi:phenylalanyl-tRNA synthetase beta chain